MVSHYSEDFKQKEFTSVRLFKATQDLRYFDQSFDSTETRICFYDNPRINSWSQHWFECAFHVTNDCFSFISPWYLHRINVPRTLVILIVNVRHLGWSYRMFLHLNLFSVKHCWASTPVSTNFFIYHPLPHCYSVREDVCVSRHDPLAGICSLNYWCWHVQPASLHYPGRDYWCVCSPLLLIMMFIVYLLRTYYSYSAVI